MIFIWVQGLMFSNLARGEYFPAVSVYMGARVRLNFGPQFRFPPPPEVFYPNVVAIRLRLINATVFKAGFEPFCHAVNAVAAQHVVFELLSEVDRRIAAGFA